MELFANLLFIAMTGLIGAVFLTTITRIAGVAVAMSAVQTGNPIADAEDIAERDPLTPGFKLLIAAAYIAGAVFYGYVLASGFTGWPAPPVMLAMFGLA